MAAGIVDELKRKAAAVCPTIVYPEPEDPRIIEAATRAAEAGIAKPVLVGPADHLPQGIGAALSTETIRDSDRLREFAREYARRRLARETIAGRRVQRHLFHGAQTRETIAGRLVQKPLFYGAMMVSLGYAQGMVAGISHPTTSVLQAAGLAIGYRPGIAAPSSSFIMVVPKLGGRENVLLLFADCAVNIEPTPEQLAEIALASAETARQLLAVVPRVAMLSFSTHGSASHQKVDLVRRAAELAAQDIRHGFVEGELQIDAALVPEVAAKKLEGHSEVAGRANVLVFPDLNAGNIAYKAVQYLGGAQAVGPILQGFAKPVNDLSRGATVEDVIAITAITALQV